MQLRSACSNPTTSVSAPVDVTRRRTGSPGGTGNQQRSHNGGVGGGSSPTPPVTPAPPGEPGRGPASWSAAVARAAPAARRRVCRGQAPGRRTATSGHRPRPTRPGRRSRTRSRTSPRTSAVPSIPWGSRRWSRGGDHRRPVPWTCRHGATIGTSSTLGIGAETRQEPSGASSSTGTAAGWCGDLMARRTYLALVERSRDRRRIPGNLRSSNGTSVRESGCTNCIRQLSPDHGGRDRHQHHRGGRARAPPARRSPDPLGDRCARRAHPGRGHVAARPARTGRARGAPAASPGPPQSARPPHARRARRHHRDVHDVLRGPPAGPRTLRPPTRRGPRAPSRGHGPDRRDGRLPARAGRGRRGDPHRDPARDGGAARDRRRRAGPLGSGASAVAIPSSTRSAVRPTRDTTESFPPQELPPAGELPPGVGTITERHGSAPRRASWRPARRRGRRRPAPSGWSTTPCGRAPRRSAATSRAGARRRGRSDRTRS